MGLRLKYNIVLFLACFVGIAAATVVSYFIVQKTATEDIMQSISLLRSNAIAVRTYTVNSIDPLLSDNNDILFLPETVTSYAARTVFSIFQKQFPEFSYKEAALNPTNPADLPNELEARLIEQLRANSSLDRISTVVENDAGRFFTVAFPLTITQQGCLSCHSTPEAAPPAMVDLYGPNNGFGWQMGETIGAQIISAPMEIIEKRTRETGLILMGGLVLVFLLVFVLTNLMISRIVVRPVRRMSDLAEKVSMGDFSQPEYRKPGKDEISSLSLSFNRMRRSLERAMSMIDG
jgi:HAMP domain-containing protein